MNGIVSWSVGAARGLGVTLPAFFLSSLPYLGNTAFHSWPCPIKEHSMRPTRRTWPAAFQSPLVGFSAVVAALGVAMSPTLAATEQEASISVDGAERTYTMYRPDSGESGLPIVIVLHGGLGNGERTAARTGFADYVDQDGFIAVFPDAGGRQWNDGRETTNSDQDDVAFLLKVVQDVATNGGDRRRVFVAGGSNGGMMAQRLACEAAGSVTAIGVVNGNLPTGLVSECSPARPVPIIVFGAPTDPVVPWDGGEIKTFMNRGAGGTVISTPKTVSFWAQVNGCSGERSQPMPDVADDGTTVSLHSFGTCGATTELYEVKGGGHTWPGSKAPERPIVQRIVGNTSQDISATRLMVDFFSNYGL
jgi:polyhydroxybutyrate depolymerase